MRLTEELPVPTVIKLAAIAVHAEELLSDDGRGADRSAILGLLADHDVRVVLDDPANGVYLPLKRVSR